MSANSALALKKHSKLANLAHFKFIAFVAIAIGVCGKYLPNSFVDSGCSSGLHWMRIYLKLDLLQMLKRGLHSRLRATKIKRYSSFKASPQDAYIVE